MAEKILNTRIALKIDTLENWGKSTLPLKKGELALATVAASAGTALTEPVVMIKVGEDGVKTFKDLEWNVYAKAADVLAACKSEAGLRAFVNGVIADAGIATNEAMEALSDRVTTVEGDLNTATTGLKARMTAAEADIDAIEAKFGFDTVALEIENALKSYSTTAQMNSAIATAKGEAVSHADDLNTAMDARVNTVEGKAHTHTFVESELNLIKSGDVAKWNAAEQNAKNYADGLDQAMDSRVDALEAKFGSGTGTVEAQISAAVAGEATLRENADADLQEQIEANDAEILALQGLVGDTKVSVAIENAVNVEKERAEGVESGLNARLAVVEGDYLKAADKKALQDQIDANESAIELLTNGVKSDEVDGVNDLIQYVKDHGTEVTGIKADIKTNADDIDDLEGRMEAAETAIGTKAATSDVTALTSRVTTVEGKVSTLEGEMDTAQADIEALEGYVGGKKVSEAISEAIAALKIGDYAKAADLTAAITQHNTDKAALETEIAKKANDADLAAIAKTGSTDDLVQGTMTLVFDCGGAV